jgi:hypothetical protein
MPALDFAGARLLEPLGRTFVRLQLWHKVPKWVLRQANVPQPSEDNIVSEDYANIRISSETPDSSGETASKRDFNTV